MEFLPAEETTSEPEPKVRSDLKRRRPRAASYSMRSGELGRELAEGGVGLGIERGELEVGQVVVKAGEAVPEGGVLDDQLIGEGPEVGVGLAEAAELGLGRFERGAERLVLGDKLGVPLLEGAGAVQKARVVGAAAQVAGESEAGGKEKGTGRCGGRSVAWSSSLEAPDSSSAGRREVKAGGEGVVVGGGGICW